MLEAVTDLHLNGSFIHTHARDVLDFVPDSLSCSTRLFTSGAVHACHDLLTLAMFPRLEVLRHPTFASSLVSFALDATMEDWDGFECTLLMQYLARCPNLHTIWLQGNLAIEGSDFALLFNLRKVQQLEVPPCNSLPIAYLVLRRLNLARLAHAWRDIRTLHIGWIAVSTADDYLPSLSDLYALRTLRVPQTRVAHNQPRRTKGLHRPPNRALQATSRPSFSQDSEDRSSLFSDCNYFAHGCHDPGTVVSSVDGVDHSRGRDTQPVAELLPATRKPLSEDEIQRRILHLSSICAENVRVEIPFVLDAC